MLPLLFLFLLLCACQPAAQVQDDAEIPVSQVLEAMLDACGEEGADAAWVEEADLARQLEGYYGLSEGQWEDAAIARQGGASAFELTVILLAEGEDLAAAQENLQRYLTDREGDFTGYAPDQARLAADGAVLCQGRYLALAICEDTGSAAAAFAACWDGSVETLARETALPTGSPAASESPEASEAAEVSEGPEASAPPETSEASELPEASALPEASEAPEASAPPETSVSPEAPEPPETSETPAAAQSEAPAPSPSPAATAEPEATFAATSDFSARYPYTDPHTDDMTLYDTSAILAAWDSGERSALSTRDGAILSAAEQLLARTVTDGMSDYEKEHALYRWLVANVEYDWDHQDPGRTMDPNSANPYGALVNRKAICLGYATTFQLLMDMAGVECITVVGAAFKSQDNHAWNMVRLDGNWYCVDATWDMGIAERNWAYFNVSSDWMAATDHQWDYASVPEAAAAYAG